MSLTIFTLEPNTIALYFFHKLRSVWNFCHHMISPFVMHMIMLLIYTSGLQKAAYSSLTAGM